MRGPGFPPPSSRRCVRFLVGLLALALTACGAQQARVHVQDEIAAAERAFARDAATQGIRASFLAAFAPDGIVFEPGPVRIREAWAARPEPKDPLALSLAWDPAATGAAASGTLGYSTGPWTLEDRAGSRPPRHGVFFSIWRREADGWRVALDVGIGAPGPVAPQSLAPAPSIGPIGAPDRDEVRASEREIRSAAGYRARFADDAWLLRDGAMPFVGRDAVLGALAADGDMRFVAADVVVAASGDFAYSYGTAIATAGGTPATGHYLHLWTRDAQGDWRILVAVRPN